MRLEKRRATILFCSAALVAVSTSAIARPVHKSAHRHAAVQAEIKTDFNPDRDQRYPAFFRQEAAVEATSGRRHGPPRAVAAVPAPPPSFGGVGSSSLVAEARKYLGTNPTGRKSLWCGAFLDMVLRRTGHPGGGNLAKAYASYGPRVNGPQIGAIAVMGRKGGGHVGVVSGVDANGNPIIVSGNHNKKVAESVYPKSRIIAYVMPGG